MSRAGMSIFIYAIYLAVGGALMILIPNVVLTLIGHPTTNEPWVRLFGALAMLLGIKGLHYSRLKIESMFQLDVYTRTLFASVLLVLVLIGIARPILLILSIIDYGASLWTQWAIWADKRSPRSAVASAQRG